MSHSETAEAVTVLGIHDVLSPQLEEEEKRETVQPPPHIFIIIGVGTKFLVKKLKTITLAKKHTDYHIKRFGSYTATIIIFH